MKKRALLHLVYPHGPGINCPETIGRHLAQSLAKHYDVVLHRWDSFETLKPDKKSLLLGHPHPVPGTVFRKAAAKGGWRRVLMLCPFNADPAQVAWLDSVVEHCDSWLAFTGPYWERALPASPMARWLPRFRRLDLAVDQREFPFLKKRFAAPGRRAFIYLGHSGWPKNTAYLAQLAAAMPSTRFSWAGSPRGGAIPGVRHLGLLDFRERRAQTLVAEHDFMITVGSFDANPATILEAMAWGLVPVCTPQSGYETRDELGVINVPLNNVSAAVTVLKRLQFMPLSRLKALSIHNRFRLDSHYHWARVTAEVVKALEEKKRPALDTRGRLGLRLRALVSPFSFLHPRWILRTLFSGVRS